MYNYGNFKKRNLYFRFLKDKKTVFETKDVYPCEISINNDSLPSLNRADIKIFNLNKNIMSMLSFISNKGLELSNMEVVCLNDNKIIYVGDIIQSIPVWNIPNPYLHVEAMTDIKYLIKISENIFYENLICVPIKTLVKKIFYDTNKSINFFGVDEITVLNPRYQGSKIRQLEDLMKDTNINITVDYDSITVYSKDFKDIKNTVKINCDDFNIIGGISKDKEGVNFKIIFDNTLSIGKTIKIIGTNQYTETIGDYQIYGLKHSLSSLIPNGDFFTEIKARYI